VYIGRLFTVYFYRYMSVWGTRWSSLVEALRYMSVGRGFDSRWRHPSGRTMTLGLTQSLTEMSKRNISWE